MKLEPCHSIRHFPSTDDASRRSSWCISCVSIEERGLRLYVPPESVEIMDEGGVESEPEVDSLEEVDQDLPLLDSVRSEDAGDHDDRRKWIQSLSIAPSDDTCLFLSDR